MTVASCSEHFVDSDAALGPVRAVGWRVGKEMDGERFLDWYVLSVSMDASSSERDVVGLVCYGSRV